VDDNEFNTILAVDTLKSIAPNMSITEAISGQDAIEKCQQQIFDIILMDIQMPGMSGTEATHQIRTLTHYQQVPIIAMTANVMKNDIENYLSSGMNDHIPKPFVKEELLRKILNHIHRETVKNRKATHFSTALSSENSMEDNITTTINISNVTDTRFLKSLTGNNPEKEKKYIQIFLQNAPNLLAQIKQGIEKEEHESIKIGAHSLKTQLQYMGVKEEISHIYQIEKLAAEQEQIQKIIPLFEQLNIVIEKVFEELNRSLLQ
jgi:FOG: CheY-like receiver